jgi:acid stress chaperone HdeB
MANRSDAAKKLVSQVLPCVFLAAAYVLPTPSADGKEFDHRTITCRAFLASGQDNMAALFMWLLGYHAGKTGIIPYQDQGPYAGRLGAFCKQHPDANLIETSEKILTELDHGT